MFFEAIKPVSLTWKDGLPYSTEYADIYFSKAGGLSEAYHVFIAGNQLIERWQALPLDEPSQFIIAEAGFGSGLNFLLAWMHFDKVAPQSARLHYISVEKHPLTRVDLEHALALWPELSTYAEKLLAIYPVLTPGMHVCAVDEGRVQLTLMLGDVLSSYDELLICGDVHLEPKLRAWAVDAWFLDGFAPAKNPEMWSADFFTVMAKLSKPGATLATFSAATPVKHGLEAAGFKVERQRGYKYKREMIAGFFEQSPVMRSKRYTPWHVDYPKRYAKEAIVLGAGLAGAFSAHELAKKGWRVTVLEAQKQVGLGASGNRQAVLYPNFSAYRSPLTRFMLSSFLYAAHAYSELLEKHTMLGELAGILQLAVNEKAQKYHAALAPWLMHYPELGRLVSEAGASHLAGIDIRASGLFVPQSGWIDSEALCHVLLDTPGITVHTSCDVQSIQCDAGRWQVASHDAPVLIVAAGFKAAVFEQTAHLPLKTFAGQMTSFKVNDENLEINLPICGKGHILPKQNGAYRVGATYRPGCSEAVCDALDDMENLKQLAAFPMKKVWTDTVEAHWAGVRAATPDYLPLVGPVGLPQLFSEFNHQARFTAQPGAYQPGLYVCAGFGSRGLTTIPLAAHYIASLINQEPHGLTRAMAQSLSPGRFLRG